MAIAAGDYFSAALLNNGTIVEWGDNTHGETTVPQSNSNNPVNVNMIGAGGSHAMAAIWSPLVQYPVNVAHDLLLIYNSNSIDSYNVFAYYTNNRPMVSDANVLALECTNGEIADLTDFYSTIFTPIQSWLATNPTKRPAYVVFFNNIPSRIEGEGGYSDSVQYNINSVYAAGWRPFVSGINRSETGGTNDCIAYINKLASIGSRSPGKVVISASAGGYGNSNYYFDDTESGYDGEPVGGSAAQALMQQGVSSNSIFYTNQIPDCGSLACHVTGGTNVAGYFSWGSHSSLGTNYATNYSIIFTNQSAWYLMETMESFNGQRVPEFPQGNFLSWYASNSFGGVNYSNTPVGAVSNVEEHWKCAWSRVRRDIFWIVEPR